LLAGSSFGFKHAPTQGKSVLNLNVCACAQFDKHLKPSKGQKEPKISKGGKCHPPCPLPGDSTIEQQGFTITVDGAKLNIINIYLPPTSCCHIVYQSNLQRLLASHDEDTLIVGDFNAHNSAWISQSGSDHAVTRGNVINSLINGSNLTLLNEKTPTRVSQDGSSSSPDLTIVTPHLSLGSVWNPVTTLNCDHLPIIKKIGRLVSRSPY